jgi:DNA-binding NarL/FixJ family response regulator
MAISIFITDDHPLAIEGLQNMLYSSAEIEVRGTFVNGVDLLAGLSKELPDVLLLDILLPDCDGTELAATIMQSYPELKILAITSLDAPVYVKKMMKNGCKGYILKNTDKTSLIGAIKDIFGGRDYIDPALKEKLNYNFNQKSWEILKNPELTNRELEILRLIMEEKSSQDIASQLYLSLRTVETHRFNLCKKLGVNNKASLVKTAMEQGIFKDMT